MHKNFPGKRRGLTLAVTLAGVATSFPVIAQDSDVEEVIVTGSYIRGTPQDAPSPVEVIDRDSIEAQGASVIWDVIRNLDVNSGSETSVAGSSDASQLTGTAQVNLRNLGGNSTLTLINGKRQVPAAAVSSSGGEFVDLNSIPLVMTDRVEILTDGGSALYGSDAVAGVVNVIMRTDFEGIELYGDVQGIAEAGDLFDKTISGIWGWASDSGDTHFVLSGEYFERDAVPVEYANFYGSDSDYNGTVGSLASAVVLPGSSVNPAYLRPDLTALNIAEDNNSNNVYGDPLCLSLSDADGTPFYIDNRYSGLGGNNATCREDVSEFSYVAVGSERSSFAAAFNHTFSEAAEFYSFFQYSDADTERKGASDISSRSVHAYLAPPGAHNGGIGQDAELGFFAPSIGLTRPTEADIPNSPLSLANGGLGTMMQGTLRVGWPRVSTTDITKNETMGVQAGVKGEFFLEDRAFNYDVSYSWSSSSIEQNYQTLNRERSELALQGLGGPNCTPNGVPDFDFASASPFIWGNAIPGLSGNLSGLFNQIAFPGYMLNLRESISYGLTSNNQGQGGCEFFNPFLTALTDPSLANSPEMIDWMIEDVKRADKRNKLAVFDAVISGELFELPGGTAQFAAGGQYRERNAKSRAPVINKPGYNAILSYDENGVPDQYTPITNNLECAECLFNFDHDRDVKAAFVEFSLPLIENVETQLALRWEDYGGNIGAEVTPKFAMSWRPVEDLLVRGSYSQSFRAPNIGVVEESFEAFSASFQDPLREQDVRAGLVPPTPENARRNSSYTVGAPNPDLGNESADTYSLGFQWTPSGALDGFNLGMDFWRFEVSDRVLPQIPVTALDPEIAAFTVAAANQSNYVLNESLKLDANIPFESCSPAALESQYGRDSNERLACVVDPRTYVVPGVVRLPGSTTATLTTIELKSINAGNIEVQGVDLKAGYNWDTDYGRFRAGLSYTHVDEYLVNDIPGYELGLQDLGKFDAAGTNGDSPIVNSLPDNKGSITLGWSRDNHRVTVINRHIGSYQILGYAEAFENASDRNRPFLKSKSDSYSTWDLQYGYTHDWGNTFGTTVFTLGLIDAFNAELPETARDTFDRSVYDGRGRRIYARALMQF